MAPNQDSASKSLPPQRAKGEAPRAFAKDAPPLVGSTGEGEPRLMKPAPDILARSPKTPLPKQRHAERPVPALTPAVYQTEPVQAEAPRAKTVLPAPRAKEEGSRLKHRAEAPEEPRPEVAIVLEGNQPGTPPPAVPATNRLAPNKVPKFLPFKSSPVDEKALAQWHRAVGRRRRLWLVSAGVLLLAVLGVLAVSSRHSKDAGQAAPVISERVLAAQQVAAQFLLSSTLEARAALVRHPDVTQPRMAAWHAEASRPLQPYALERFAGTGEELTINGRSFVICHPVITGVGTRALALEETSAGFRVDWESFVFWAETDWLEFVRQGSTAPAEFRVAITPAERFEHAYADATKFYCFQVSDPENREQVWVYAPLDSEIGHELNLLIRRCRQQGASHAKAILRLRFEEAGRAHRQAVVEAIVQDGWIVP